MSALDKIRQAFPELANASDSEVLGEAARRTGSSVAQLSDTLGIAPRSTLGEIGRQFGAGLTVDAPRMAGQALKYFSDAGGERVGEGAFPRLGRPTGLERQYGVQISEAAPGYRAGQALVESADVRGRGTEADLRGRGLLGEALVTGARGVGGIVPTLGLMAVPGGQVLAPALQAGLFGGSSAQDTYEKLVEQGIAPAEAEAAARRVFAVQGLGEGVATAGLGALLRPAVAAARGARSTSGVAQALTDTSVLRPFARGMALNVPLQAGTEAAQDVGTSLIEQSYGAAPEDLGGIARGSALAGAGMTLLLGPLALGGSISRARNAERLQQALYSPDASPEVREAARQQVMEAARQQGVAPANAEEWLQRQLREEAANIATVQQQEEQTLDATQETPYADIAYALRDPELSAAMSEPDRTKLFSTLTTLQAADTPAEQRDALLEDANETIGRYVAALQGPDAESDLTQPFGIPRQPALTTPQPVQEINLAGGLTQVQTNIPDSLSAYQAPTPAGREMPRVAAPAPVEGVEGIEAVRPGVFQVAQPLQQVGTFVGPRPAPAAAQPVTPPGAPAAAAAALPAAPAAAGVSSTPVTTGAPSGTQAPQAVKAKTQRAKAPAAPAAAVVTEDDKPLLKLIEDADNTDVGNPLPASVRGAETVRAPGRASMTTDMLKKVRDALLRPSGKVGTGAGAKEQRIVDALNNFASSYKTYLDQGGQVLSRRNKIPKAKTAEQFAETQVEGVQVQAANVQAALAELGEAVGGNAKDIEAVVRLVKDMVQGKIVAPGKTRAEVIKAGQKLDTMLSQAWAAAKRETFMQAEPDLADIRGGAVRVAREQAGEVSPLEKAASEGVANPRGKGEKLTGLQGVLQYIRNSGTPFERMLAGTLRDVIGDQMSNVKLEFITEGDPRFDPKTNTVFLRKNESPEVSLHEALHAALQSFIYKNPKDPVVMQLKRSLKAVVDYKGELTGKAKEVQDLLKKLVADKNELDAVLELVSYGTTLNEFRKALEAMPSKGVPESFRESVNSVWRYVKAAMARMLGKPNTVAADVLDSSLALLEKASKVTPEPNAGNVLEASVTSDTRSLNELAQSVGYADASQFAKGPGAFKTPTQVVFEMVGLGRVNGKDLKLTRSIKESGGEFAEWIRKNAPTVERTILNFNSRFSNGPLMNSLIDVFKFDQNTGYLQMEKISQHLTAHPELAKPFLDFMDGNTKTLDGVRNAEGMKAIATNLRGLMKKYIDSLPANSPERRTFERVPFSQYLLHPNSIGQVAGSKFGVKTLAGLLGTETRSEASIDGFKQLLATDSNGDVDLNDPLYQLFEDKLGQVLPAGFISKAKYEAEGFNPAGMKVATDRIWKFSQFKDGDYKFSSSMTAKQATDTLKTEELSAALLNTTAALAHTYASRNFLTGLKNLGRQDGKASAQTIAFDNVEEVNSVFPDRKISDNMVLKVSDESSRAQDIRLQTQRTGTWVQLPASENYGDLAGKIVPGPVWNAMLDMHDRSPLINVRAFNSTMAFFKKAKTVYNPGTHVTNILSNVTLATMHGLTFRTMGRAAKMFVQFDTNPGAMSASDRALVQAFYDSGAVLGQFSSTEVKQTVYDKLSQAITPDSDSSYLTKLKTFANYEKNKARLARVDNLASDVYAAEDNVFRLAAFLNVAGNLQVREGTKTLTQTQMEEAGLAARKMFLDYDIDARAIRAMRQSFLPFISWSYAIMPVLGRMAIEKPWAMANVLMAYALMSAAMEGEDEDEMRKAAPDYLRDRAWGGLGPYMHVRIPFVGDSENPVYFNLGKYIPMFTLFQPPPGEAKLAGQEWIPGFATPSGPLVTLISAMNGYDPFTGKPMHNPTDTQWDKLVRTGKAAYDTMAPAAVNSKFWDNIGQLADGVTGPTGVEKSALFLARNLGGLGLYQFNVDESRFYQDNEVKKIEREFSTAMNKAKRLEMSKGYPDYEALDAELDTLAKRLEQRIAKIRGEEPPEE